MFLCRSIVFTALIRGCHFQQPVNVKEGSHPSLHLDTHMSTADYLLDCLQLLRCLTTFNEHPDEDALQAWHDV